MRDDLVPVRAGHVLRAALGDGIVLLDRRAARSHVLNASAAAVWDGIDGATPVAELADGLARRAGGGDHGTVVADVGQIVDDLVGLGLVRPAGEPEPPWAPVEWAPPPPGARARPRPGAQGAPRAIGPFLAAAVPVVVAADDPEVRRQLADQLASLPAAPDGDHLVEVRPGATGDRRWHVLLDGRDEGAVDSPTGAVDLVATLLNRLAVAASAGHVRLHAGAVEVDGRAVVVAGSSGHGKSTLTAALVRAGHGYLTDELVAIGPDGCATPYPKAIDLAAASCRLLGIELPPGPGKAPVAPSRLGRVAAAAPIGAVVVLTGRPGAPPTGAPERLDPPDALVALLPHTFGATFDDPDGFERTVRLAEDVPVHRLDQLDLASAVEVVAHLPLP